MKIFFTKIFAVLLITTAFAKVDEPLISSSNPDFKCTNDLTTLSVGDYAAYLWNNGAITPTITVNQPGYYSVTVVNGEGNTLNSNKYRLSGEGDGNILATIETMGNTELCPGETITLFGNEGFRYEWSTGDTINNLMINQATNISLTLIDSIGCRSLPSDLLSITVFNPTKPSITITGPKDFCNEADGTTLIAEFNPGLNFSWNTGDTAAELKIKNPGSYYGILSNDSGCEILSSPVFIDPINTTVPAILSSSDFVLCPGEVLTLTAYFDSAAYDWSNGETTKVVDFTEGGNFTLNLVDENGCRSVTAPIEIEKPDVYIPDIFSNGPTTFCEGSSVVLKADADPDHFWQWQNGSQALDTVVSSSGEFYISSLDFNSGCRVYSDTVNVIVGFIDKPLIKFDTDTILCRNDSIVLYSNPSFAYFWMGPDANSNNQRDSTLTVKNGGQYELAHINDIGCVSAAKPITIVSDTLNSKPSIVGDFNFELNVFEDYVTNASETTQLLWESNGGIINLPNVDTVTVFWDEIEDADLCVTHISEFGCEQEKICISDIIISINDIYFESAELSPNPCTNSFRITGIEPNTLQSLKIYNSNGALIKVIQNISASVYNFEDAANGLHLIEIVTNKGSFLKKLYKQ